MQRYDRHRVHPATVDNRISVSRMFIGGLMFALSYLVLVGLTV